MTRSASPSSRPLQERGSLVTEAFQKSKLLIREDLSEESGRAYVQALVLVIASHHCWTFCAIPAFRVQS